MLNNPRDIPLHSEADFAKMRTASRLAAETLDFITPYVEPGITTDDLNRLCHNFVTEQGGVMACLGYRGFPKSICTSINHVVCHGIPGPKVLKKGDIVNIDVTTIVDGWYGDTSRMYTAGKPTVKAQKLIDVTYEALMAAIDIVRPGTTLGDIGYLIQTMAEKHRYSIVRDFCGHGIGQEFHTPPSVLHYGRKGTDLELKKGMIFTIEPMLNAGKAETKILSDGWTAVTRDRSLSAQFEHTIGVTDDGCEIFTLSPKGLHRPPYDGK